MFLRQKHVVNSLMKLAPDFPCLADEIAEPHPDMNIKVSAFTGSEKSSNKYYRNGNIDHPLLI